MNDHYLLSMMKKIKFKIKNIPKPPINDHYVGLIFIYSMNTTKICNHNKIDYIKTNLTSIFLNNKNQYPIFKIENIMDEKIKYKKHIRYIIKQQFSIKTKHIISIKLANTFQNIHNYIIVLTSKHYLDNGQNIQNTTDHLFHWRTYIDLYNSMDTLTQIEIYNKIINNKKYTIKPIIYEDVINNKHSNFKLNNHINYTKIIEILSIIDFGY